MLKYFSHLLKQGEINKEEILIGNIDSLIKCWKISLFSFLTLVKQF